MTELLDQTPEVAEAAQNHEHIALLAAASVEDTVDAVARLHNTYYKLADPDRLSRPIESQIRSAERKLGIRNRGDRALEAALCIDSPILSALVITGQAAKPERIFGDEYWADHLDARAYAEQAKGLPLDIDLISDLQRLSTHRSAPEASGVIRNIEVRGGRYDDPYEPATYTAEEVAAIESHPHLDFVRVPADDAASTTGYIGYPYKQEGKRMTKAIEAELQTIADWYNETKADSTHNPYALAAELQQRIVTLHPFLDGNGRVSRMLMNWSLTSEGLSPAILDEPDKDVMSTVEQWSDEVESGVMWYEENRAKKDAQQEAGLYDLAAITGYADEQAFYDAVYKHINPGAADTLASNLSMPVLRDFSKNFLNELEQFNEFAVKCRIVDFEGVEFPINQGGLITEEYIKFASSPHASVVRSALYEQLYSSNIVYRGAGINSDSSPTEEEVLSLFEGYTAAAGSNYALGESYSDPKSLDPLPLGYITQALHRYNILLGNQYLTERGILPHPSDMQAGLGWTVENHVGGITDDNSPGWYSPFVSTSMSKYVARNWADNYRYGIVIEAALPHRGIIATSEQIYKGDTGDGVQHRPGFMRSNNRSIYPGEREIVMPGAILPAGIQRVEMRIRNFAEFRWVSQIIVERNASSPDELTVTNHAEGRQRTYRFDVRTSKYILADDQPYTAPDSIKVQPPLAPVDPVPSSGSPVSDMLYKHMYELKANGGVEHKPKWDITELKKLLLDGVDIAETPVPKTIYPVKLADSIPAELPKFPVDHVPSKQAFNEILESYISKSKKIGESVLAQQYEPMFEIIPQVITTDEMLEYHMPTSHSMSYIKTSTPHSHDITAIPKPDTL